DRRALNHRTVKASQSGRLECDLIPYPLIQMCRPITAVEKAERAGFRGIHVVFERITSTAAVLTYCDAMLPSSSPELSASADSPYGAELQRADPNLRFSAKLESEYVRNHLLSNRTLIRMACLLAVLVAVFRAAENTLGGSLA